MTTISSLEYIGAIYKSQPKRETLSITNNQSPSTIPDLFLIAGKKKERTESVILLFNRVAPSLTLRSDVNLIKRLITDIQDHAENRLQLFFQQLLISYQTGLEFRYSGHAHHQVGLENGAAISIPLQEAHSSTLPCLLVQRGRKTYIFGSDTSFYYAQNTTVKLPAEVNRLDTWIDTATREFAGRSLRDKACDLIQDVSDSIKNPKEAFQSFIGILQDHLKMFAETHRMVDYPKERKSCEFYLSVITSYRANLVASDVLLKTLCFKRRSLKRVDERFFLKVQKKLHSCLEIDLRTAQLRDRLLVARPTSNTQSMYAGIYRTAPDLHDLLRDYFEKTPKTTLVADWKEVVGITATKKDQVSAALANIVDLMVGLIKANYGTSVVQKVGAITASMLFQASLDPLCRANGLYKLTKATRTVANTRFSR